jgi:hypothetical protein
VADFYRIIANHLVRKEIITEEQKNNLVPDISIAGRAKDLILIKDTTQVDSLQLSDFEMIVE